MTNFLCLCEPILWCTRTAYINNAVYRAAAVIMMLLVCKW